MKITKLLKYDIIHGFYSNKDKAGTVSYTHLTLPTKLEV